jgi:hypothetical protein
MLGPPRDYITEGTEGVSTYVEAVSNTSTVTPRVVGGDEKVSLKSETVKYGRESKRPGPEKDCTGKGRQHIQKRDPSSRQRGRPTKTRPQLSKNNRQSQCDFDLSLLR